MRAVQVENGCFGDRERGASNTHKASANKIAILVIAMTLRWLCMSAPSIQTVVFTQITARNGYLYNPEKTLKLHLNSHLKVKLLVDCVST